MHGPPMTTTIDGHFLGTPPSVLSLSGHHLPPPLPSATSIPNYGFTNFGYSYNGYGRGRRGYGYGRGVSYAVPYYYYVPQDSYGYGYDYVGGPQLYSGAPMGADPALHIIVEQPPARAYSREPDVETYAPAEQKPAAPVADAKPGEPTVLVYRDGHRQEVTNYAIMGQTVYVFDKRTQKIALTDLDVAATVKANDDRGQEFQVPPQKPAQNKDLGLQPKSAPDKSASSPSKVASVLP
jgi:hypothetical protein